MKQFVHVTVADLAAYRENPEGVTHDKAYSLYGLKRWITGMGKLTPTGEARLKQWDALGEAARLTPSLREELAWVRKHGAMGAEKKKVGKLRDHKLVDDNGITERGKVVLDMYAGEGGAR